jgi:AcrR family transcriptional regulator
MADRRPYTPSRRAETQAATRARILAATRELIPSADTSLPVSAIAHHAGVAVQTIYDQFGSKGGLLIALIGDVQQEAGLFRAFPRVFSSPHGEEAMRRMVGATAGLWHRAWPYLEFILRAQRVDAVVRREMGFIDALRHAHYWAIARRIEDEGRIRHGHDAAWAADASFALTIPTIYEELAVRRAATESEAVEVIVDAVLGAILEPGTEPVLDPPPDWSTLTEEAAARARSAGADPDRLSGEWATGPSRGSARGSS